MAGGQQRQDWEDLSVLDPYWAILSDRAGRFGRWDKDAFLARGEREIDAVLADGRRFGLPRQRADALDFGCGAGRLTLAISRHFRHCLGLDISERMIGEARELAAGVANCEFAVHDAPDLAALPSASFDLVVSRLVLQHIPSAQAKTRYIAEFIRVLRPGGLLAFQLPSEIPLRHRIQPRPRLYGLLRRSGVSPDRLYRQLRLHPIRMSALASSRVFEVIDLAGAQALDVHEKEFAGGVTSNDYLVAKPSG
jgi:SAM-dependent methyltransferase